jgi:hypothetical protein
MGKQTKRNRRRVVRASAFEPTDDHGRIRAALRIWPHGGPGLALYDARGEVRMVVGVEHDQPVIVLTDAAGGRRLDLRVLPRGVPSVALCDAQGRLRLKLDLAAARGEPCLVMLDEAGKPKTGMMISERTGEGIAGTMNDPGKTS